MHFRGPKALFDSFQNPTKTKVRLYGSNQLQAAREEVFSEQGAGHIAG